VRARKAHLVGEKEEERVAVKRKPTSREEPPARDFSRAAPIMILSEATRRGPTISRRSRKRANGGASPSV